MMRKPFYIKCHAECTQAIFWGMDHSFLSNFNIIYGTSNGKQRLKSSSVDFMRPGGVSLSPLSGKFIFLLSMYHELSQPWAFILKFNFLNSLAPAGTSGLLWWRSLRAAVCRCRPRGQDCSNEPSRQHPGLRGALSQVGRPQPDVLLAVLSISL